MLGYLYYLGHNPAEDPNCPASMLVQTLLKATAEDDVIAGQARGYLVELKDEVTVIFETVKEVGELLENLNSDQLTRRYQSHMTGGNIVAHRGVSDEDLTALPEDAARSFEQLRVQS